MKSIVEEVKDVFGEDCLAEAEEALKDDQEGWGKANSWEKPIKIANVVSFRPKPRNKQQLPIIMSIQNIKVCLNSID